VVTGLGPGVVAPRVAGADPPDRPLTQVVPDRMLNCRPRSRASDWLSFFESSARRPPILSCATVVWVDGVGLFGPPEFGDLGGTIGTTPLLGYRTVDQRVVETPGVTRADTTVSLPGTGLVLTQRDRYRAGDVMDTEIVLRNGGSSSRRVVVYRTGDCFPGADVGYPIVGPGAVGCEQAVQPGSIALPAPGPQYVRWRTTRGASSGAVGPVDDVRNAIASGRPLRVVCACAEPDDIAAGLSWTLVVEPRARVSVAHDLTLSVAPGRDPERVDASADTRPGASRLLARVTVRGRPVVGATVAFVVGSLTPCRAATDDVGMASCAWSGPVPAFRAIDAGDTSRLPAEGRFVPSVPPPPTGFASFPDCARFDPTVGLLTSGDAHHEWIGATTDAPPCPGVEYRALVSGTPIGSMRGNLRTTTFIGTPAAGFVALFIEVPFGKATLPCPQIESIDTRTGAVVDVTPCLPGVAGQKFR
jgi:hypothetical protein